MRSSVHYMRNASFTIAILLGSSAYAASIPAPNQKLILHGLDCNSEASCIQSRAVLEEAARILQESADPYIVQTSPSAVATTQAFLLEAGVDANRFRIDANDGSDVASCEPAIAALTCR